jgi:hypothetical protein
LDYKPKEKIYELETGFNDQISFENNVIKRAKKCISQDWLKSLADKPDFDEDYDEYVENESLSLEISKVTFSPFQTSRFNTVITVSSLESNVDMARRVLLFD